MIAMAKRICEEALREDRHTLLESELYEVLQAGGIKTPGFYRLDTSVSLESQVRPSGSGAKVVVKVESPLITHKTEMGGIRVVNNDRESILAAAHDILKTVRERGGQKIIDSVKRLLVIEFVNAEKGLGSEVFIGLRWSPDMGPVVAMGFGGLDAEEMAARFAPGESITMFSPLLSTVEEAMAKCSKSFAYRRLTGQTREAKVYVEPEEIRKTLSFFFRLAREFSNHYSSGILVEDFEINPFFVSEGRLVAVDAFMRFSQKTVPVREIDVARVRCVLEPKTVAIIGVSARDVNFGRVILRNLLREKFPLENIRIIREGVTEIDGVTCCPSVAALPFVADLFVVAVSAQQIPELLSQVICTQKANSMLLVSGGMGETESGREIDKQTRQILAKARSNGGFAPVLVGPNCLGIRSRPGRYDTLFIPEMKLPMPDGKRNNLALVSQSGAFMITRMDALSQLDPIYSISVGNQMDLTHTDFTEELLSDDRVGVIGLYMEGFQNLDGLRLARMIRAGTKAGKDFIVYKAGRTAEGITAASSHTASISSDYNSCVELLRDAGALIAGSFEEFNAYVSLASALKDKDFSGLKLGLLSNAGFETVGMADNVSAKQGFKLARFLPETLEKLNKALERGKLASLVGAHNPLDVTPGANDEVLTMCVKALCEDDGVDAVVAGFVPMTVTMRTLPTGADPSGQDCVDLDTALPALLAGFVAQSPKPLIAVVDAGHLYDRFAHKLNLAGVPCFRSSDFALRTFQSYLAWKVAQGRVVSC